MKAKQQRDSHRRWCSVKKGILRNFAKFTGKHMCQTPESLFLIRPEACNFIKKETLAQVFSWEFCKILRTPFLQNTSGRLLLKQPYVLSHARSREKSYTDIRFPKVIGRIRMYLTSLWDKISTSSHGLKCYMFMLQTDQGHVRRQNCYTKVAKRKNCYIKGSILSD